MRSALSAHGHWDTRLWAALGVGCHLVKSIIIIPHPLCNNAFFFFQSRKEHHRSYRMMLTQACSFINIKALLKKILLQIHTQS